MIRNLVLGFRIFFLFILFYYYNINMYIICRLSIAQVLCHMTGWKVKIED